MHGNTQTRRQKSLKHRGVENKGHRITKAWHGRTHEHIHGCTDARKKGDIKEIDHSGSKTRMCASTQLHIKFKRRNKFASVDARILSEVNKKVT